jgi:hypothetical protein
MKYKLFQVLYKLISLASELLHEKNGGNTT